MRRCSMIEAVMRLLVQHTQIAHVFASSQPAEAFQLRGRSDATSVKPHLSPESTFDT